MYYYRTASSQLSSHAECGGACLDFVYERIPQSKEMSLRGNYYETDLIITQSHFPN